MDLLIVAALILLVDAISFSIPVRIEDAFPSLQLWFMTIHAVVPVISLEMRSLSAPTTTTTALHFDSVAVSTMRAISDFP